ncbi:TolC family type I secretion outer membrane protein [Anaerospora hongkongensis]|uniref:TolC family type I secretion outer membrane protein n=2 Tax=Anaerospora hongkongensis TaxID=244830 RepID=A0A4R1Q9F1_9FIRM|nr:TolC family protein [Anaerospora hongkongensis]TCL38547.1 TolC family type I secretion outer membrane protein [Anaerospora hongkongensis]
MNKKKSVRNSAKLIAAVLVMLNASVAFAAPVELSLSDSVALALKNNPSIKMAQSDKDKSQWSVSEAQAGRMPTVSLGNSYSLKDHNPAGTDDLSGSLRMNWQLYSGGRVEGQIDQAKRGVGVADLGVEKTKQQLKLDTTTAYFTILQTKNLVEVNQQSVSNLQEHLNSVQAKYDVGVVAKSDVLRAEVELANAQQNLIKAQNNYDLAVAGLLNTMTIDPGTELALTDTLSYNKYDKTLDDSLQAAQTRPDVAQAEENVKISETAVKMAKSGKLPSVSLSASNGWNGSVLPGSGDDDWSVGLSASWSIFDAGSTSAKVKQADALLDKAKEQLVQVKNSAALEVRQNYLSMQEAEKRIDTNKVAVGKAEEDLVIAREKYNAGVGTNLDVIDAQLALTQAKTNEIQALFDYNVNVAKIDKAIGLKAE